MLIQLFFIKTAYFNSMIAMFCHHFGDSWDVENPFSLQLK